MKRINGKNLVLFILALCAIFPFVNFSVKDTASANGGVIVVSDLNSASQNATYLKTTYANYTWTKNEE